MIEAKVAYLEEAYDLHFRNVSLDDNISSDEILCETLVSVISPGTEVAAYTGMPPLKPGNTYPRLVGYCNVARVLKIGNKTSGLSVGDRVLTTQSHRSHFIIKKDEVLCLVPQGVESQHAACGYLYHLGYDAVLKAGVNLGQKVVVIGLGVLGLTSVAMASKAGGTVYGISNHAKPKRIALNNGAQIVYERGELSKLKNILGEQLADVVITTSGTWSDWDMALDIAGQNSFIAVLGFPGRGEKDPVNNPLDSQHFYTKQLHIKAVGRSPENNDSRNYLPFNQKSSLSFILDEINLKMLNPDELITANYSWNKLEEAYLSLISKEDSPITYLLEWKK